MIDISNIRKKLTKVFSLLATVLLVACSSEPQPELFIDTVSIYANPDANHNSATEVDLVIVYDLELMKTLSKLSASKYFSDSRQLLLDNPTMLDIWHWELVPGQIVDNFRPPQDNGDSFGAFVFANYLTDGDHRVKVAPNGVIKIILERDDLKNYAIFNATEPKAGTTVTDIINEICNAGADVKLKVKRGPVQRPMPQTCMPPCPLPCEPIAVCPPPGKPLPILKRPLAPPPLLKSCNKLPRLAPPPTLNPCKMKE